MITNILKIIAAIHLGLGSITIAQALDIPVPDSSDIVDQSTAIYLVKLSVKGEDVVGEVVKNFKSPEGQKATTVKIASPYPEMNFPFQDWVRENTGKEVIVLGRWLPESGTISLIYGPGSTWPKGGPKIEGKTPTTTDCVKFIEKKIFEKPKTETK